MRPAQALFLVSWLAAAGCAEESEEGARCELPPETVPPAPSGPSPFAAAVYAGQDTSDAEDEVSIAADAGGNVVAAHIIVPFAGPRFTVGISVSHDHGATFAPRGPPDDPNGPAGGALNALNNVVDPSVAVCPDGTFAVAALSVRTMGFNLFEEHILLTSSTDGGRSWLLWTAVVGPPSDTGIDKPWLLCDADSRLVLLYTAANEKSIRMRRRPQGSTIFGDPLAVDSPTTRQHNLPMPGLSPSGDVYVAYLEYADDPDHPDPHHENLAGSAEHGIFVSRLAGGSAALERPVRASGPGDLVSADPLSLAVGPGGEVFVAYTAGRQNRTDIFVVRSDDQGRSFGAPVKVNDDPTCATHMHPALAVDERGTVHVAFYDNRDGAGRLVYTSSTDGGATFAANAALSPPFTFQVGNTINESAVGDYLQLFAVGSELYAAWGDPHLDGDSSAWVARASLPP